MIVSTRQMLSYSYFLSLAPQLLECMLPSKRSFYNWELVYTYSYTWDLINAPWEFVLLSHCTFLISEQTSITFFVSVWIYVAALPHSVQKQKKKKGERAVCIKPVCSQICQLSCWCRGSGIIPSPWPGSEDWSMHFLSLLSVTKPAKGFMARIWTQTYTHQCTPSGRTNTMQRGRFLNYLAATHFPDPPSTHTYPKAINKAITHIVYMLGTRKVLQANFPKDVQTFRGSFTIFPINSPSHRGYGSINRKGTKKNEELIFRPDPDIELKSVWSWSILAGAGLWRRMGVI